MSPQMRWLDSSLHGVSGVLKLCLGKGIWESSESSGPSRAPGCNITHANVIQSVIDRIWGYLEPQQRVFKWRTPWHRAKRDGLLFWFYVIWKWFQFLCDSGAQAVPGMLTHDRVWELLLYGIWGKFLDIPFWPSYSFCLPLSHVGPWSSQLWPIWKIWVLDDAVGGQRIDRWGEMQNKQQWLDNVRRNWQSLT